MITVHLPWPHNTRSRGRLQMRCVYISRVSRVDAEFSLLVLWCVLCMRYQYVFNSNMSFRQWSSAAAFSPAEEFSCTFL